MANPAAFLALPGELRNRIYAFYASTYPLRAVRIVNGEAIFICAPSLAQVSRQIRQEVLSLESEFERDLVQVVKLTTTVTDFDFTDFASFFRQPSELPIPPHPLLGLQSVRLELVFTQACMRMQPEEWNGGWGSLRHWTGDLRLIWIKKLSMEITATFQPPELDFEQSGLSSLLEPSASQGLAGADVVDPEAVAWALRSAIRERDDNLAVQRKVEKIKVDLEAEQSLRQGRREERRQRKETEGRGASAKKKRHGRSGAKDESVR